VDLESKEARKAAYPLKTHPGASNKANVFLSEVLVSLKKQSPQLYEDFEAVSGCLLGKSDDAVAACVLQAYALRRATDTPVEIAVSMLLDPEGCKQLTLVLKSLGLNGCLYGAMLCEGNALQGRGVESGSGAEDREYRLDKDKVDKKVHHLDRRKMREAIREVLKTELDREVEYDDKQTYWTKRWLWCVNGAHSKTIEKLHPDLKVDITNLEHARIHRKVFAENIRDEQLSDWDGKSYFSQSEKLEGGKTRYIYAGDTLSYFVFEYLLRPVENTWLNRRVILDPGSIGTFGMSRRIRRMRKNASINVMLDYDDMNARHSNWAMRAVFEELIDHIDFPDKELGKKICDSFDNCYMSVGGTMRRIMGTLMSGHRATTFINSVLNYAYIKVSYPGLTELQSMHVGDDVYMLCSTYDEAYRALKACSNNKLAMNAMKQSVGEYTAEFLRVAYKANQCVGYVARTIASCVCGNWVNEIKLDYREGLETMISHAWTYGNRPGSPKAGLLLKASFKRIARISGRAAEGLLTGAFAREDGPCRYSDANTWEVMVEYKASKLDKRMKFESKYLGTMATTDYLTYHTTPIESYALSNADIDIKELMVSSSYKKTFLGVYGREEEMEPPEVHLRGFDVKGTVPCDKLWDKDVTRGALSDHPLLQMMKEYLKKDRALLRELVLIVTNTLVTSPEWLDQYAWGNVGTGVAVEGYMSWADACIMARRGNREKVTVAYNCFV
jgi:hypothetical protein